MHCDALQNKQYLVDVNIAIAQAISYFDSLGEANRTQAVVFDIDETALSNLPVSGAVLLHACISKLSIFGVLNCKAG